MHASDILRLLLTYRSMILADLAESGITIGQRRTHISSSYSFVTLDIRDMDGDLECRVCFELGARSAKLDEVFCEDKTLTEPLRLKFDQKKFPGFEEGGVEAPPWSDDIRSSIEQADKLAALCVNCTSGDNYRPGRFSTITIYDDRIELEQINKMNAKSLDHKTNYSLRSLEFVIPLSAELRPLLAQYKIGNMLIEFSDGSSENNRQYGETVREELERLAEKL